MTERIKNILAIIKNTVGRATFSLISTASVVFIKDWKACGLVTNSFFKYKFEICRKLWWIKTWNFLEDLIFKDGWCFVIAPISW